MSDKSAKQPISNTSPIQPPPPQDNIPSQKNTETPSVTSAVSPEAPAKANNVNSQSVTNGNPVVPVVRNSELPTTRSGRTVKPVNKMNIIRNPTCK